MRMGKSLDTGMHGHCRATNWTIRSIKKFILFHSSGTGYVVSQIKGFVRVGWDRGLLMRGREQREQNQQQRGRGLAYVNRLLHFVSISHLRFLSVFFFSFSLTNDALNASPRVSRDCHFWLGHLVPASSRVFFHYNET